MELRKNIGRKKFLCFILINCMLEEGLFWGRNRRGSFVFFILFCVFRCVSRGMSKFNCCVCISQSGKDVLLQSLRLCFIFYLYYFFCLNIFRFLEKYYIVICFLILQILFCFGQLDFLFGLLYVIFVRNYVKYMYNGSMARCIK